jgi:ferredoxin-NADP reductase
MTCTSVDPPRFELKDLDSTNGTFKNGIEVKTCEFGADDKIAIGNIDLSPELYLPLLQVKGEPHVGTGKKTDKSTVEASVAGEGAASIVIRPTSRFGAMVPLLLFVVLAALFYVLAGMPASPDLGALLGSQSLTGLIGAFLVSGAVVQLGLWIQGQRRRLVYEDRHQAFALKLIQDKVDAAQRQQSMEEQVAPSGWKGLRKFEVARKVSEGGDICSFYLVPHDGKPLCSFKPGQYLTFNLKVPGHAAPVVRCYSLSASTAKQEYYRVSIKRIPPPRDKPELPPGLSSGFFHDQVEEGAILDVKAPAGHFFIDTDSDAPVVLIGGGVGITPVLSMLESLMDHGSHREVWFFYGVRNHAEHIMEEHLRMADQLHDNVHIRVCYSDPDEDSVEGVHYHHGERVSVELFKRILPSNNYQFYICGPPPMMDSLTTDLEAWGVPRDDIHFEAFGPASAKKISHGAGAGAPAQGEYAVTFEKSGKNCQWTPESGSLLELAEANGVVLDFGCRAGNCGTCLVAVREGKVDYYHDPGVEPEAGSCLTCIAHPAGESGKDRLVLDA